MPNTRTLKTSFVGGEVAPELYGRLDLDKTQSGLALCQNFVVLPQGPVQNRAGTHFVSAVKNAAAATRLISFSFSNSQTFAIELGSGYFRFHTVAATLMCGAGPSLSWAGLFCRHGLRGGWSGELRRGELLLLFRAAGGRVCSAERGLLVCDGRRGV